MKGSVKFIVIITIGIGCLNRSSAQDNIVKKPKIYETWVRFNNNPNEFKGVIYEIKDSSIVVANAVAKRDYSSGNFKFFSEFNYRDIDFVQIRKFNSIRNGLIIGAVAGYFTGSILAVVVMGGEGIYTAILGTYLGLYYTWIEGSIGLIAGTIKRKIPVNGSYEKFNLFRGDLQEYSFIKENPSYVNLYKPKFYFLANGGPSIPVGDLADISSSNDRAGYAKIGTNYRFIVGFRFSKKLGVSVTNFSNKYNANKGGTKMLWEYGGLMAGPVFTTQSSDKLFLDLKPSIGITSAYLTIVGVEEKSGNGPGVDFSVSLMYNFFKRWSFQAEVGYFYSYQFYDSKNNGNIQSINLNFGLAYRFGKQSL